MPGILPDLNPQNYNSPVDHFRMLSSHVDGTRMDLNPPYQRGSVWGQARKKNLIKSLVMGLPIGAIFLNLRHVLEPYRVVDGKQRIEAILDFIEGRLTVPAEWFDETQAGLGWEVSYPELPEREQRFFSMRPVAVYNTSLKMEEQERELFSLINFGGVEQGQVDSDSLQAASETELS